MSPRSPFFRRPSFILPGSAAVLAVSLWCSPDRAPAQSPRDFSIDLQVKTATSSPYLTLSWTQRLQSNITTQKMYRRLKGEAAWTLQKSLTTTQTSYADTTAVSGVEYEYWMDREYSISPTYTHGYISAGTNVPAVEARGTLLLVIDNTMVSALAPEIAQLVQDLTGDGWTVQPITAQRSDTAVNVRAQIKAAYDAAPAAVKMVYLLGHVPVPYSGLLNPDGHGDHFGAWPADAYYGDMDGTWTDSSANNTSASRTQNDNIPGDGKFDQTILPGTVELQVGRVDLSGMTKAPSSAASETTLLRRYLRKAHDFRHRLGAYANIPRRSMIRDGFGYFGGENFATTGWATAFTCVGSQIDTPGTDLWYTQATGPKKYLWAYGNGGGSYESASSVGTSTDFGRLSSQAVFTGVFGSYHGDWDAGNNFMRSILAGNAQGDSLGLCCLWAGRPEWFMHPLGMGETLGYIARLTQNNTGNINSGYLFTGIYNRYVHVGLVGDPALRFHMIAPPRGVAAQSTNGQVALSWIASEDTVLGYHVYRSTSVNGPFTRLNASIIAETSYTDTTATAGTAYQYMVRAQRLETVPGGSYQNLSYGTFTSLTANAAASAPPRNAGFLTAQAVNSTQTNLTWTDLATDETGFRIERRTILGNYATVGTVGANVTSFTDPGPFMNGNVYYYRVVATNAVGDATPSNEVSTDGAAGFLDLMEARVEANRAMGSVQVELRRLGGATGTTLMVGATADDSAIAGTHYIANNVTQSFADGVSGSKLVNILLPTGATPALPRQFRYTISSPTGGAGLTLQPTTRVLIVDPQATLPKPWQQAVIGTVTDSSAAVFAENALGSPLIGGSMTTSDGGRFIYQSRTGDGVLTAFIDAPLINQTAARFGVMIRGTTTATVPMASVMVAGDTTGTNLITRVSDSFNPVVTPGSNNAYNAPRWIRLTRAGNDFTGETSTDGYNWSTLGTATINVPAAALWGLFHIADTSGNFQTARFRHVSITDAGMLAASQTIKATAGAPMQIAVSWDPVGSATGYRLERRPRYGTWTPLQTFGAGVTSFIDTTVQSAVAYEYQVQAFNGAIDAPWSPTAGATAPGTRTAYQSWLIAVGLPADGGSAGALTAAQTSDGIPNAMKFALGVSPYVDGYDGRFSNYSVIRPDGGIDLMLQYLRPEPPPTGISYVVETSEDLTNWSSANVVEVRNTAFDNLRSILMRESLPVSSTQGWIRLRVVVP